MTENLPPSGTELPVSNTDFLILAKARQILSGPSVWNRHDDRNCEDDAKQNSWGLSCALYQASIEVAGTYLHLRPVMMDVRAALAEHNKGKERLTRGSGPLVAYNNLESVT